jgi:hypothetical protein
MDGQYVNDKFEKVWKEVVVAYFYGTIPAFAWKDRENSRNPSVWMTGFRAEI